ncbi:MAG TPA: TonB-dependent receptor [Steroidobacteraceae bacterium]|nr:TonB-dependent receptor [Steroidobacteraceae bacterium]
MSPSGRGKIGRRSSHARCAHVIIAVLLAWLMPVPCGADAVSTSSLKSLSVEDLMNIEVTSVSKQPEALRQAASAIQVITSEDIRRSGATTLPEALRLADNLEVAQENAHDWAISARGFNANLANKLLVLIDGRAVYSPLYGGVLWNVQDYLLEDIDRIEVISGPGGTLWGANAVNGVINIITKSAKDSQGLYAQAAGGNQVEDLAGVRDGAELARNVYLRVYGKYIDQGDEVTQSGARAEDSWHVGRGGFRMDAQPAPSEDLTLQGDVYNGSEDYGAIGDAALSGGNVLGRWTHAAADSSSMSLQAYYDYTYLAQPFAASAPAPYYTGFPAASLTDVLDTADVDFQHHLPLGERHQVIWGLGYRATHEVDEDASVVRFSPPVLDQALYSGFLQDEIMLAPSVHLILGSKLEHNDYTGWEVEPNTRLRWDLDGRQMLWGAVSRAVRTPSRYDRDLEVPSGLVDAPAPYQFPTYYLKGNPDFVSETLIAYETGYRAELTSSLSGSVSLFYNDYNDLRSTSATATTAYYVFPYPIIFENNLEGETHGLELSATYQLLDWWRLRGGYDLLREDIHVKPGEVDATGAANETADPQQQVALRSSMDLPRAVQLDAALRWVDQLRIDNGPTGGPVVGIVPSYFELDSRLAWRVTRRIELSIVGQNLLHPYHVEYGFPSPSREAIERSVFGKITWRY